jgi:hypothetical protein
MTEILILTILSIATCTFAGFLHGYKKGYGEGKRAGYFRAHAERVSQ